MFLFAQIYIQLFIIHLELLCHNHFPTMDFTHFAKTFEN